MKKLTLKKKVATPVVAPTVAEVQEEIEGVEEVMDDDFEDGPDWDDGDVDEPVKKLVVMGSGTGSSQIPGELLNLLLEEITPNEWNPQVMDDKEFNMLAESMKDGMLDPIQVVPIENHPTGKKYRILGGEHRWQVAKSLGWTTIPALVLTGEKFQDTDLQKFLTVRMNVIHGKLNPEKFRDLYEELSTKYEHESLQNLLGFTDSDVFDKLVGGVKDGLKAAGLPKEMIAEFSEVVEEMKTVDDLSTVLNRLFTKYGDTLRYNFMVYSFGGKEHLYIKCEKNLYKKMVDISKKSVENEVSISDVLMDLMDGARDVNFKKYDKVKPAEDAYFEVKDVK